MMRAPIYRNLDRPLRILGFRSHQLIFLGLILVAGGELADQLAVSRVWSFVAFIALAFTLFVTNKTMGEYFMARLMRFLKLPDTLSRRIFSRGRWR